MQKAVFLAAVSLSYYGNDVNKIEISCTNAGKGENVNAYWVSGRGRTLRKEIDWKT
jgi:hypothetical protein